MSDNPTIGLPDDDGMTIEVHGVQRDPRKSSVTGVLRTGFWVKITAHRFYDYRNAANLGVFTVGSLSGTLAGTLDEFTGPDDPVAMPLHRVGDPFDLAFDVSEGKSGENPATSVHTFTVKDHTTTDMGSIGRNEVVGTVVRCSTQKSMGQASGRFTIVAKVEAEWRGTKAQAHDALGPLGEDSDIYKYLDSGDWIEINIARSDPRNPEEDYRCLMVGKVDSVTVAINPPLQGGVTLTIEGRDVGSVLEDTPLYFNQYDPTHNNPLGIAMTEVVNQISGTPDEVVVEILGVVDNPAATFGVPPVLPDGGLWTTSLQPTTKFVDVMDLRFVRTLRGLVHQPSLLTPGQYTPLWSYTQTYGVPEMNEWWVDTLPIDTGPNENGEDRLIYMFGREKPFVNVFDGDDSNWFDLTHVIVNLQEVRNMSVTRSGANRYNHINVLAELPSNITQDIVAYCKPAVNFHSVLRWGLKKLDVTVALHAVEDDEDLGQFYEEVKQWRDLMICWNVLNPYYWEGTITLHGIRADIRVGAKIVMEGGPVANLRNGPVTPSGEDYEPRGSYNEAGEWKDDNLGDSTTFYVEAVSTTWGAGVNPVATTTLQVSRGYVESKRLPDIKALYALWEDATDGGSSQIEKNPVYPDADASLGDDTYDDGVIV